MLFRSENFWARSAVFVWSCMNIRFQAMSVSENWLVLWYIHDLQTYSWKKKDKRRVKFEGCSCPRYRAFHFISAMSANFPMHFPSLPPPPKKKMKMHLKAFKLQTISETVFYRKFFKCGFPNKQSISYSQSRLHVLFSTHGREEEIPWERGCQTLQNGGTF